MLAFPDFSTAEPLRCPACETRFRIVGRAPEQIRFIDYYRVVGVPPNASASKIKQAIRVQIRKHHPDRNPENPKSPEILKEVLSAREVLTDQSKRSEYDSVHRAVILKKWGAWDVIQTGSNGEGHVGVVAREADIDHLRKEIDGMDPDGALTSAMAGWDKTVDLGRLSALYRWLGVISLGIAWLLFALGHGWSAGGAFVVACACLLGWFWGSRPGGLAALAFFVARIYSFSFLFFTLMGRSMDEAVKPGLRTNIEDAFKMLNGRAELGALLFGIIGTGYFLWRSPYAAALKVHRTAAVGAILGALIAVVLASHSLPHQMHWRWFAAFAIYLALDVGVFSWLGVARRE